ncbi:cysteine-rich venom protein-like [Petromyzon marinus]|uniref:cysteine-rich venom protein-like n=1 Tax=Petromyzon marinus TaxID=7757 RepID=UPI003F707222
MSTNLVTPAVAALAVVFMASVVAATSVDDWKLLDTTLPANQEVIVNVHNELRRNVAPTASNMLKMAYNEQAAGNSRLSAAACSSTHSARSARTWKTPQAEWDCGENIFMSSNPRSWDEVVHSWYDEVTSPGFQYGKGATGPGAVGHYTQVVWYKSHQVGCAVNYCPNHPGDLKYFYVCQYCPTGNLDTRINKPYDLGTPCQACPHSCDNNLCTNPCPYADKYNNCRQLFNTYGCGNNSGGTFVQSNCPATCKCRTEVQ